MYQTFQKTKHQFTRANVPAILGQFLKKLIEDIRKDTVEIYIQIQTTIHFCLSTNHIQAQQMAGKGGKGLVAGKTTQAAAANKEKDSTRRPISRSSRAGLQVSF